jgi:preprotein translocase subunit YajC
MHFLTILASADNESSAGGGLLGMLPLLALPLLAYFLLIRPNRRRMREQQDLQAALAVGDEIVTTAGIYGFITGFEGDRVWVEVDDDVQLRIARAAIQGKATSTEATATTEAAPAPSDSPSTPTADNGTADE